MTRRWHLIDEHEMVCLIADHQAQRRLCTMLERVADGLPDLPPSETVAGLEQQLASYADRPFPLETALFERLSDDAASASAERIVDQIRHNHAIDTLHAEDLSVELRRLSGSSRTSHPGELAYMLRCFFDGCRRAMAFEKLALLNLGGERLTPAARDAVLLSFRTSG